MEVVSALGLCDENYGPRKYPELKTSLGFSELEHVMLTAIVKECRSCISSEGHDCYPHGTTSCPFKEERKMVGLDDIEFFDHHSY